MFCINPIAVGDVPVLVKAQTRVAGLSDAVERILKVKVSLVLIIYKENF